jgi:hypothetical protein
VTSPSSPSKQNNTTKKKIIQVQFLANCPPSRLVKAIWGDFFYLQKFEGKVLL